jgi:two-component system phosphate regulon sensor histidine kinase PhoR
MFNLAYLRALVVVIGLSLFTLLVVQFYWLNNAIRLEKLNFISLANNVVSDVSRRLESQEALDALYRAAVRFQSTGGSQTSNVPLDPNREGASLDVPIEINRKASFEQPRSTTFSSRIKAVDSTAEVIDRLLDDQELLMNKVLMVEFIKEIQLSRQRVINERVKPQTLDSLLKSVLYNYGIDADYSYELVESDNTLFKRISLENKLENSQKIFFGKLFPSDLVPNHTYLVLRFDGKQPFFYKNIVKQLALSLVAIGLLGFSFFMLVSLLFRQKRLSELKTDFINNMTHELKTPIATISLASEALINFQNFENLDSIKRYNKIIHEENDRLKSHVERILNIALLEKSGFSINHEQLDLHKLLEKVIEQSQLRITRQDAHISFVKEAQRSLVVADGMHLINVFTNLIDNALKYTRQKPFISIKTSNTKIGISIFVTDNGIGMNQSQLKRIFEKFYRVPTGDVHDVKGFGLGLSYVKTIIELHGGYIKVTSELGKGSTFEIYLPFEQYKMN